MIPVILLLKLPGACSASAASWRDEGAAGVVATGPVTGLTSRFKVHPRFAHGRLRRVIPTEARPGVGPPHLPTIAAETDDLTVRGAAQNLAPARKKCR